MHSVSTLAVLFAVVTVASAAIIPYHRVDHRPENPPFCQSQFPFCPNGTAPPVLDADDTIEVWALKAPIWEFKFGDMMAKVHGYHDAIGIKSIKTGKNYTLEYYELDQLFNCTFPHEIQNKSGGTDLAWCNQGATCFYDGIDDLHWVQNGTMDLIAHGTGDQFNKMAAWQTMDNNTGPYYESWSVVKEWEDDFNKREFVFESYDCKDYVLRVYDELHRLGVQFNASIATPKYSYIVLHADEWEPVDFEEHREDMLKFYAHFQKPKSVPDLLKELLKFFVGDLFWHHKFYLYYNEQYYLLKLKYPYLSAKWAERPLPGINSTFVPPAGLLQ